MPPLPCSEFYEPISQTLGRLGIVDHTRLRSIKELD